MSIGVVGDTTKGIFLRGESQAVLLKEKSTSNNLHTVKADIAVNDTLRTFALPFT